MVDLDHSVTMKIEVVKHWTLHAEVLEANNLVCCINLCHDDCA